MRLRRLPRRSVIAEVLSGRVAGPRSMDKIQNNNIGPSIYSERKISPRRAGRTRAAFKPSVLSAFAEDHGRKSMDECARGTLRSSESEGWCFGGLRRRNERYHGGKPVEASLFRIPRGLPRAITDGISTVESRSITLLCQNAPPGKAGMNGRVAIPMARATTHRYVRVHAISKDSPLGHLMAPYL